MNAKAILDLLVGALNYFPGLKTKAGAVLQVIGTLMLVYNHTFAAMLGFEIPVDLVLAVNAAAATLVAVGAANQPENNKPPAA
jgi:predicted tellurium resistance membrane protein TerC